MSDDWDDDFEHDEWADEEPATDVVPCPHCGADVYEDAPQCPVCGEYIVHATQFWSGRPLWWIALALAGIVAVIAVLSGITL